MKTGTSVLYSPCKLLKKTSACRIWEGREFTRAAKSSLKSVALQRPRIAFQSPNEFFSSLLWALTIGMAIGGLPTQRATAQESKCFSIHVRLNGKAVDSPQVIALQTKQGENAASLEGGCFKVPSALLTENALDIFFTVPGNRVHLSGIAIGLFAGPWDIDLADKKFGSEVALPKHASAREACAVVFHVGEPETQIVQTGCRTPAPQGIALMLDR